MAAVAMPTFDHRGISIQFLRSTGLIPVKVQKGAKSPFPEWDPRSSANQDHSATLLLLAKNDDLNLGALFHGRHVDIDVDTTDVTLLAALDYFLPRTPYVWGRKSKPRSHRAYALHEEFERPVWSGILRFIKGLKIGDVSYSVEIRGGKPENGLFTVLPGSYRADVDERIEWAGELDPTVSGAYVPIETLIRSVRMAQAAAIIAPHWTTGVRNDLSLALAGLTWRIRKGTLASLSADEESDVDPSVFLLREEDAQALFVAIMKLAGDDPADARSRSLNLRNTWRKLDTDPTAKITGGKVMATLLGDNGDLIVKALYRLLSDSEGVEQLEQLAEQFVMWYREGVLVDLELAHRGHPTPWMGREAASNSMGGKKITLANKKVPVVSLLFNTQIIQRVFGLTFDPSTPETLVEAELGLMVNQWRGFAISPCLQSVTDDQVEPFLDYVYEILANRNAKMRDWILNWTADIFQYPSKKPGVALVLVGVQGAGKTFFGERLIAPLVGKAHYTQVNSIAQLTDKFNAIADNKIFIQCDEAIHSYQKEIASRLKSIITDETMTVEPKGVNSYKKPNHMRFLFTSNEESTAIFIDPSPFERRFTVSRVSKARANDMEYWSRMHLWASANREKLLRWLLDRKYDRIDIHRPLMTDAKRNIQRISVDAEVAWIISRVASGFLLSDKTHKHWFEAYHSRFIEDIDKKNDVLRRDHWPDVVQAAALEADFKSYVREHGRPVYSGAVLSTLRKVLPDNCMEEVAQPWVTYMDNRSGQVTRTRVRLYSFPSTIAILENLREKYGSMVDTELELEVARGEKEESAPVDEEEEF
jgi:hypothetical protein